MDWILDVIEDEFRKFRAEDYPCTAAKVARLEESLLTRIKENIYCEEES